MSKCIKCGIYNYSEWCKSCQLSYLRENFKNWTSGNEEVDKLIQEMQLKINSYGDIVFEWIPYDQFDDIKGNNMGRLCLAMWKDGPLVYDSSSKEYIRNKNNNIALKYISRSQNIADKIKSFTIKKYASYKIFGISQNPDTNDYIFVLDDVYCIKCSERYASVYYKMCSTCKIQYSRDEAIDNIIQKIQFEIDSYDIFEWIPYAQFDNVKEMDKSTSAKVFSALWKKGSLQYDNNKNKYIRIQNEMVALKYIYGGSQNIINEFNEIKNSLDCKIYGISQNPDTSVYIMVFGCKYCEYREPHTIYGKWCEPCQINYIKKNFTDCADENKKIDNLIQKMHLKNDYNGILFEWIPYDQFNNIKEMDECSFTSKIYSAVWENGPSYYNGKNKYVRNLNQNKSITLKNLCDPQNNIDEILNEIKNYSDCEIYGISQNSDTKDYIIVLEAGYCEKCGLYTYGKWCKLCRINYFDKNFTVHANENEKIDYLIQKMQLKSDYDVIVFEWIPYNLFNNIKVMDVYDFTKIYSAVWENGPSYHNSKDQYIRNKNRNKEVKLKSLCNLQNITGEFLNVDKSYTDCILYGISQAPSTKDYIVIFQDEYCEKCNKKYTNGYIKLCIICQYSQYSLFSENEKIDELIQEMQLKINSHNDIVFEWIPYSHLDDIKKISEGDFATEVYSAIWKNGLLYYDYSIHEYKRTQNKKVILKYLYNSQNFTNIFINKIKTYPIYGISQHPETKDYVIVFQCSKEKCTIAKILTNWTSVNDKIDELIQGMQLKVNSHNDIIFEWVPYSQFDDIKEVGQGGFAKVYAAKWKNGPLFYDNSRNEYIRTQNKKVALKCLHNSQNISDKFLNEVKAYSIKKYNDYIDNNILKIYGISQNPITKDYIMIFDYAEGGNFDHWTNKNYRNFDWSYKLTTLWNIIKGLKEIHQKQMVHNDFHTGNILLNVLYVNNLNDNSIFISDMGLCGKVDDIDQNNIYGVMPYVAPEILKGKLYTQSADIYSFGMIMYFVGTGKQPFSNCAHDQYLALSICNGIRPEINEPEIPKCYGELMKKCWNSNPDNRPKTTEILESIDLFFCSYKYDKFAFKKFMKIKKEQQHYEIEKQYKEAEEYRKSHLTPFDENKRLTTHPQAFYTSRLLNPFTKDLPKDDNIGNNSVEVFDFTNDE